MTVNETYPYVDAMLSQINRMDLLAISGGRVKVVGPHIIELPVAYGYLVRVIYQQVPDTYTVQRVFRRGGNDSVKAQVDRVYCDQLSEVCYRASCYHEPFPNP